MTEPLVSRSYDEPQSHFRWEDGQWQQRWRVVTTSEASGAPRSEHFEWRNCVLETEDA